MDPVRWKVGELAAAAGVTVRALHHFDEIGLLRPSERSTAGHRLYTDDDARRLYRVLALRGLGIPLGRITEVLDGPAGDLTALVDRQLAALARRMDADREVHRRLTAVRDRVRRAGDAPVDLLLDAMEAIMTAGFFDDEQLARMRRRHEEIGAGDFAGWLSRAAELDGAARALLARGIDPADDEAQELARTWTGLVDAMAGGDRRIRSAMYAKFDARGAEAATKGIVSSDTWTYLRRAFAAGFPGEG
jgi:MerR family transcriptional regulator, thiopeptide resistance regulator